MKNIFKRNKTYYYRIVIPKTFRFYFNNLNLYIISLKTSNKNEAILLSKFLNSKLNYIKRQAMLLSSDQLNLILEDFKTTNLESIKNRHKMLTIKEIDKLIKYYDNNELNLYDDTLKKEIQSLGQILLKNDISDIFDTSAKDIDFLVNEIIQIKLNVLHNLKENVNRVVVKDIVNKEVSAKKINTIEYCKTRFLKSHDKKLRYESYVNLLIDYCNKNMITNIEDITNEIIKEFRNDYFKLSGNSKTTTNGILTHLFTFFKFCKTNRLYSYENPCESSHFDLTPLEKANAQRDPFSDDDVKKIFSNIDIIKTNQRTKKPRKYAKEYELIIRIAMYSGARESEIISLTINDIIEEPESKIKYFRFIVESEEESIKNYNSWRFVPIHNHLEPYIMNYINSFDKRRKCLFTITPKQFGKDFSKFKKSLEFGKNQVFHSFRHSVANKLKNQAKDIEVSQEITGHAKNTTFNRYAKSYDVVNKKEVLDKIFYKLD